MNAAVIEPKLALVVVVSVICYLLLLSFIRMAKSEIVELINGPIEAKGRIVLEEWKSVLKLS